MAETVHPLGGARAGRRRRVRNDRGQLRSYRVDRIASIRPTAETFTPRYSVEF